MIKARVYADPDAVLRSALQALFLLHPEQKLTIVVSAYREGEISLGRAAELLGISSEEMKDVLRQQHVLIHLGPESVEELAQEVAAFESS